MYHITARDLPDEVDANAISSSDPIAHNTDLSLFHSLSLCFFPPFQATPLFALHQFVMIVENVTELESLIVLVYDSVTG